MVKYGYKLPLLSEPPPFYAPNNRSSFRHRTFVENSVEQLLADGCIQELSERPYCCNPLTVAEGGKLRLVLDLRHVNKFLGKSKFKYENLKTVSEMFEKDFYFCSFDLKSGYHHIPISPEHRKYLGFSLEYEDGTIRYFQFNVLPFGLGSACYAFTKLMRPLVKKWRGEGIRCVVYLDDGIAGDKTISKTNDNFQIIQKDLNCAGLTLNLKKCQLQPTQVGNWLGFCIDTKEMIFSVPAEKITKIRLLVNNALKSEKVNAKQMAKVCGHIISCSIAIGPITRIFTRHLYKFIDNRTTWYNLVALQFEAVQELLFWHKNLEKNNGFRIKANQLTTKIVYSDASQAGYGGFIAERMGNIICQGRFTEQEISLSSTHRELLAVKYSLLSFGHLLKNESVQWFSDNVNVARIIQAGSRNEYLQKIAIEIFNLCLTYNIEVQPIWLSRDENQTADSISKFVDTDNWSIDNETFLFIENSFGKFTVDRFADNHNRKTEIFNSKFYCPGNSGVNAFTCNWKNDFNWLCPPISLIGKSLKHLSYCRGKGVLLVPIWKSAYFWPLLTPDGTKFENFVKDYRLLDPFFTNNHTEGESVFSGFAKFKTIALYVVFE